MRIDMHSLILLLNWMSPTFPIGSFAYSHGLEQAIADGRLRDKEDVARWISDLLQRGSGWNDAVLFAQRYAIPHPPCRAPSPARRAGEGDYQTSLLPFLPTGEGARRADEGELTLNDLALALAGSAERYFETTQLARSFNIAAAVWTGTEKRDDVMAYPVAAGAACKSFGIAQQDALAAFLQGFCAALVSVAVRLVPLGQTAGLQVLRQLSPVIVSVAERAQHASLDDLGGDCIAADIAAMQHETLEPRIFRT
jgi:urease accessory protein